MTLNCFKKGFTGISFFILLSALLLVPAGLTLLAPQEASASDIPEWVQSIKLNGDFRFRYQTQDDEDGDKRDRFRIRLRTGVTADVTDSWKVAFGLATGGDDPRSTNQTLSDFSTGDIRLDYAYGTFSASDSIDITLGKMKNPIWMTKDLMWDGDIMPDGVAVPMTFKTSDNLSLFVTPAYFVLGELKESSGDEDLDNMLLLQAGVDAKIAGDAYIKAAATVYSFNDIVTAYGDSSTNTEDIEGVYALDIEAGYKGAPIMVAVFGQYVASDADTEETGYLLGVKFGSAKIKAAGDWQVKYNFRSLELNAVPSFLPDSDAMDGDTGIEGSEIEATVGISKNVTISIDYYAIEQIDGDGESNVFQLDAVMKF